MVKTMWIVALTATLLSGCGNDKSAIESAIYRHYKGTSICPTCAENTREAVERKLKEATRGLDKDALQLQLSTGQCRDTVPVPIVKIEATRTDYEDVWKVQVSVKCETHGTVVSEMSEWSFKDKKLRFLK